MAYYPFRLKNTGRYQTLSAVYGEESVRQRYDEEEILILDEFLAHGREIALNVNVPKRKEKPGLSTAGSKMGRRHPFYRKGMKDAPAYRQNHEEIAEALEEGIALPKA